MESSITTHTGGCHCGRVKFEVDAPSDAKTVSCNCSICSMCGYVHLIVPLSKFRLLHGEDVVKTYTFNTEVAQHYFCGICGIKSYYIPRSNPNGISVNVNCISSDTKSNFQQDSFDGQNWEKNVASLNHAS